MTLRKLALLVLVTGASVVGEVFGEGGYYPPDEMIARSEFISIVTIRRVEPLKKTDVPRWSFGEEAHAVVEQNIKGTLPRQIQIYGSENFMCQQTALKHAARIIRRKTNAQSAE